MKSVAMRSPGLTRVTFEPTFSTMPAPSWPPTIGRSTARSPVTKWSSEWHRPDAITRTRTSLSPGSSTTRSWTSHLPPTSWMTAPRACCMALLLLLVPGPRPGRRDSWWVVVRSGCAQRRLGATLALAAAADELRQDHGDDQRPAVEELLDVLLGAEQLETGDAGDQEVHGNQRAPGVEAADPEHGRTQEAGGERRQQERRAGDRVGAGRGAGVDDAGEAGEPGRDDERPAPEAGHVDAVEARDVAALADEQQAL